MYQGITQGTIQGEDQKCSNSDVEDSIVLNNLNDLKAINSYSHDLVGELFRKLRVVLKRGKEEACESQGETKSQYPTLLIEKINERKMDLDDLNRRLESLLSEIEI